MLRLKKDSLINVSDGKGQDYLCRVDSISPLMLRIESEQPPILQRREITMFFSLAKGDKLSLMLQKCTELGADKFYLLPTENSDAKAENIEFKISRFSRIVTEAAKQCGRSTLPTVDYLKTLDEAIALCHSDFYICHEKATERLAKLDLPLKLSMLIGPEGGFSEGEVEKVVAAGGKSVLISNNILRCETAAITALALAMEA